MLLDKKDRLRCSTLDNSSNEWRMIGRLRQYYSHFFFLLSSILFMISCCIASLRLQLSEQLRKLRSDSVVRGEEIQHLKAELAAEKFQK